MSALPQFNRLGRTERALLDALRRGPAATADLVDELWAGAADGGPDLASRAARKALRRLMQRGVSIKREPGKHGRWVLELEAAE
ncbi:hypothetical protein [Ferrovibrio sp.]|uniref:hypothetical protein n=1 Tax=Ferrovibrio sp. TaxID=1917215 RepID=UPI003D0C67A2